MHRLLNGPMQPLVEVPLTVGFDLDTGRLAEENRSDDLDDHIYLAVSRNRMSDIALSNQT